MASSVLFIALLMSTTIERAVAVSQFQTDASFSIVDSDLSVSTVVPTTVGMTTVGMGMTTFGPTGPATTVVPTTFAATTLLEDLNPLTGFDDPDPVMLRGDGFNPATGIFRIDDDGSYVFIIHRVGIDKENANLELTVVPASDPLTSTTLATLEDTGANTIFTSHVIADLKSDDLVVIANPSSVDVEGTSDNPFIFNAFLLYHTPISPFPRVRQSAFSATVPGNLSDSGVAFTDYTQTINIGEDFDPVSGVFEASIKGLYVFHVSATFSTMTTNFRPVVALRVNTVDRALLQARFDGIQTSNNAAVTIAQALDHGDTVQLVNLMDTSDIDCSASFVGYLLS